MVTTVHLLGMLLLCTKAVNPVLCIRSGVEVNVQLLVRHFLSTDSDAFLSADSKEF